MAKSSKADRGSAAWALAVVSSEGQADTLAHQRRWAQEAAKSHGWHLSRVVEGVATGKAGPRRIVRELVADLRALDGDARPAHLLMIRADRLGRGSIVESQIVLRDILALGVRVFTRDQGEVKLDSAMDELISAATLAVARHENEIRSEKMLAVWRRKRAAGEPGGSRTPYGLVRKNGRFVPDPKRARVVKEAFRLRVAGKGYVAIGKRLAAIAPPQAFLNGSERVVRWSPSRVSKLLANRSYVGPIVDEATFARSEQVRSILSAEHNGRATRAYPWPLSGVLKCYCSRAMIGMPCGNPPWRYRYYACKANWNHDGKLRLVRADNLEEQFIAILEKLRAKPELVDRYRRRSASTSPKLLERSANQLRATLADLDAKRSKAWDLHAAGKVRDGDLQQRIDAIATERQKSEVQLADLQTQISVARAERGRSREIAELFSRAAGIFAAAPECERRSIARAVALELDGLVVSETGAMIFAATRNKEAPGRVEILDGRTRRKMKSRSGIR